MDIIGTGSSLFKKYIFDNGKSPDPPPPPPSKPPPIPSYTPPPPSKILETKIPELTSNIDETNIKTFNEILVQSNLPGPDYIEFKGFLEGLLEVGTIPEPSAYQAAFNQWVKLPGSGGTSQKIKDSIIAYVSILDKERENYQEEEHETITNQVESNELKIKNLITESEELNTKLKAATDNINILKQQNIDLNQKAISARSKFEDSLNFVKNKLNETLTKLTNYVQ